jgi:hypothetical protein
MPIGLFSVCVSVPSVSLCKTVTSVISVAVISVAAISAAVTSVTVTSVGFISPEYP